MCECTVFFFSITSVLLLWKHFNSLLLLHKTIWSIFLEKHIFGLSRICELYWRQYEQPVGKSINAQVIYIFLDKTSSEFTRMNEYYVVRSFWSCVFTHSNQTPYAFVYTKKDGFGQMNWIQNYCLGCVTTGYTMTTLNFIHSLLQNIDSIAKNVRPYVFIFECWILYAYCATYFIHFSMELPSNMKPPL